MAESVASRRSATDRIREGVSATVEGSKKVTSVVGHLLRHKKIKFSASSRDEEYQEEASKFMGTVRELRELRGHLNTFLSGVRALGLGQCDLGEDMDRLGSADEAAALAAREYKAYADRFDSELRHEFEMTVVGPVFEGLDALLEEAGRVKAEMDRRTNMKREYDHYLDKVRTLKEMGHSDPTKLPRNEEKMRQAKAPLDGCTANLRAVFHSWASQRHLLLAEEFLQLRSALSTLLRGAADHCGALCAPGPSTALSLLPLVGYTHSPSADVISEQGPATPRGVPRQPSASALPSGGMGAGAGMARPMSAPTTLRPDPALRARLVRFYARYNPSKLKEVDGIAVQFGRNPEKLFAALVQKYGPEPEEAAVEAAAGAGEGGGGTADDPPDEGGAPTTAGAAAKTVAAGGKPDDGAGGGVNQAGQDPGAAAEEVVGMAVAEFDYAAQDKDEIGVTEGTEYWVMEQRDDGWWRCRDAAGNEGLCPGNYLSMR